MRLSPTDTIARRDAGPGPARPLVVAPTRPRRGVMVIELAGELDLASVDRARRVLAAAIEAVGRESTAGAETDVRVVCDLDGLEFLGARGLGALHDVVEQADACGVALDLVATRRCVRRVFELGGLEHLLLTVSGVDPHDGGPVAVAS